VLIGSIPRENPALLFVSTLSWSSMPRLWRHPLPNRLGADAVSGGMAFKSCRNTLCDVSRISGLCSTLCLVCRGFRASDLQTLEVGWAICLIGPARCMAHAVTSFLKRGKSDGANYLSKVQQAHKPSGIRGVGHYSSYLLLSGGSARPSCGKKTNVLRKLRECVAILTNAVRSN
jgi:hypothetical protein